MHKNHEPRGKTIRKIVDKAHRDSAGVMADELAQLRTLYPSLPDSELALARENLDCYLTLAWEIFEDNVLQADVRSDASFSDVHSRGTMEPKVDSHKN